MTRRLLPTLLLATLASPVLADNVPVRFTMDWAWQGTQSYALIAREKGYFAEEGIDITLERGFGSGRVPVDIAAGTYDMGVADINPMIRFNAENPDTPVIAVAVFYDGSPLVAVAKKDGPISEPKDLEGKTLAAPDFDAGRQLFPVFAAATGIDDSTIEWLSVKPELREPMLARGEADAITGFITSSTLSLKNIGVMPEDLVLFKYTDYGADLYSGSIMTTPEFAGENPEAVTGVIRALARGAADMIADPDAAIALLKEIEPLTDAEIERERLQVAIEHMFVTPNVLENGLSHVDMARMERGIRAVEDAYGLPNELTVEQIYTEAYLPPREDLMLSGCPSCPES